MKRIGIAALLVLALAGMAITTLAQDTLQMGTTEGSLENSSDTFTLAAKEGQVYLIAVSSDDFDSYVDITDAKGTTVAFDDDSGSGRNSAALFIVPSDGDYSVTVKSYSGDATGAYVLEATDAVQQLEIGTPVNVTIGDSVTRVFTFTTDGGPFNIGATSGGQVDTSLSLLNSTGLSVDSADDTEGVDPVIRRSVLEAGTYYLILAPYSDTVSGEAQVLVEPTELVTLGTEPTEFTFDQNVNADVAVFDVEAGKLYEIKVTASAVSSLNISVSSTDPNTFTYAYFSFSSGEGATYLFRPDVTSTMQAEISGGYSSTADSVLFTITVTEVQE